MEHLVRDNFRREGYVFATKAIEIAREQGFERIARLASNENPFPPSPLAIERGKSALLYANRYPEEGTEGLKEALRRFQGDHHFVTGVGMDGIIETLIRILVGKGDGVGISTPTFSFYGLATEAQGGIARNIPRKSDFSVDPGAFIEASRHLKLSFICSPNNPTGNTVPLESIAAILEDIDGILFLDNAYVEFSRSDYRSLMKDYDNLIIGRTFSKAYSLAGLRIGYAFVPEWLVPYYQRAQTPFALNVVSAAAAQGALADKNHVRTFVNHVVQWREKFKREIHAPVFDSEANFVMIDTAPITGDEAVVALAKRGVIVRSCSSFPGLDNHYIRACVGKEWENKLFIDEINSI